MKIIKLMREKTLQVFSVLVIVYLMLPLAVIILLSFNKPKGRQNTSWNEFSTDAWTIYVEIKLFAQLLPQV